MGNLQLLRADPPAPPAQAEWTSMLLPKGWLSLLPCASGAEVAPHASRRDGIRQMLSLQSITFPDSEQGISLIRDIPFKLVISRDKSSDTIVDAILLKTFEVN